MPLVQLLLDSSRFSNLISEITKSYNRVVLHLKMANLIGVKVVNTPSHKSICILLLEHHRVYSTVYSTVYMPSKVLST